MPIENFENFFGGYIYLQNFQNLFVRSSPRRNTAENQETVRERFVPYNSNKGTRIDHQQMARTRNKDMINDSNCCQLLRQGPSLGYFQSTL